MTIKIKKDDQYICENVKEAKGFFSRLKGLMFTDSLGEYDGLLITPCNSIHTFFMRYTIDVLFLSRDMRVLKIIRRMRPYRMTSIVWGAYRTLEMTEGTLGDDVQVGDQLEVVCTN